MTGWRVGYLVADEKIIEDLVRFHKSVLLCVNMPAQKACVAALMGSQDCVDSMRREYDKRRKKVMNILSNIGRISVNHCEGAFYFFPRFQHKLTSKELTSYLSEKKVLVRSGTEFGGNGEKHFRITFATSMENLEEGLSRLKYALDELD
jgi:aspartate aminotransferase